MRRVLDEKTVKTMIQQKRTRQLLIVEGDENRRREMTELLISDDVNVAAVATGGEALEALSNVLYDAAVISIDLPDRKGFDLVDEIRERANEATVDGLLH